MKNCIWSGRSAFAMIAIAAFGCVAVPTHAEDRPNFIIVFADDLGYADLGCYGSPNIRTPHLDKLAAGGVRFTSFYAQPICGPSRAALMTGCYPLRVAERGNIKRMHPAMHANEITIAEILKKKGYATGCFGKWDLALHRQRGFMKDLMPNHQGFDYFFGTPSSNDGFVDLYRNGERIEEKEDMGTLTERHTDEAIAFIERNRDKPFFVYMPHSMPHTRLDASEKFKGKSPRGLYGDVVEEIDDNFGRLVTTIEELGLANKTHFIFLSDNGPWLNKSRGRKDGSGPQDHGGSAGPLRSGKVSTWEGGIRVPCIWKTPDADPAGVTCDAIASTMDVLPTIAELAGAEAPSDRTIDGESIVHLLAGKFDQACEEKTFFGYMHKHLQTVRQGDWKLHLPREFTNAASIPNGHIHPDDDQPVTAPVLYNLRDDIGETTDVAAKHPEVVKRLLAIAEQARADIGDFDRVGAGARFFDDGPKRGNEEAIIAPLKEVNAKTNALKSGQKRPNIILIMADDMGYECVAANGGQSYKTPRLDELAATGMRFEHCHSQPICTPSRVQIMTGIHNNRNYIRFGLLDWNAKTFGHLFQNAGYRTMIAGKWQLDGGFEGPNHFGFDEYCLWQLTRIGAKKPPRYPNPGLEINGKAVDYRGGEYGPDIVSDYICDFLARNKDRPFFVYYPMIPPHWPFQPTPDSEEWNPEESREYPRKEWRDEWFVDMVAYTDKVVGKIIDKLDELKIRDNTLVIFTGDNGTYTGIVSKLNGVDYRGGKGKTIDSGTHVPLIVNWPGTTPVGKVSDRLVDFTDMLPTIAQTAGIDVPESWAIDGVSFASDIRGGAKSEKPYIYCWYSRNGVRKQAKQHARDRRYKLYADGRFFDVTRDFLESSPLEVDQLTGEAKAAYDKLKSALDPHVAVTQAEDERRAAMNAKEKADAAKSPR